MFKVIDRTAVLRMISSLNDEGEDLMIKIELVNLLDREDFCSVLLKNKVLLRYPFLHSLPLSLSLLPFCFP